MIRDAAEHKPPRTELNGPDDECRGQRVATFDRRFAGASPVVRQEVVALLKLATGSNDALVNGIGNPALCDEYAAMLPGALMRICRRFGVPPGLLRAAPRTRGKWATAWVTDLAHPLAAVANAIAYEVLGTDRILDSTLLGFRPCERDAISFGFKLQASYTGTASQLPGQPDRATVESDLHIHVPGQLAEIGVDFKHSLGGRPVRLSVTQLSGVVTALATGEVNRFLFVTNFRFSKASRQAIQTTNVRLLDKEVPFSDMLGDTRLPLALLEGVTPSG